MLSVFSGRDRERERVRERDRKREKERERDRGVNIMNTAPTAALLITHSRA